jgi:hypothetical protein
LTQNITNVETNAAMKPQIQELKDVLAKSGQVKKVVMQTWCSTEDEGTRVD